MKKWILLAVSLFVVGIKLSHGQCSLGQWGGSCQYNCSSTCLNGNNCTQNGGQCGCQTDDGACFACVKENYGTTCDILCNKNCSLSDQCIQSGTGCGCNRQFGYCNSCPKTLWGQYCERPCSDKCLNSECYRDSGDCIQGCVKGYHGSDCNTTCPTSCSYGCDKTTAECFPAFCVNCLGGLPNCDRSIQKCKAGCVDGFYGDSCDKTCAEITKINLCTKCAALTSVGITVCSECQSGYFYDGIQVKCVLCNSGCKEDSTTLAKCFPDTGNCRFGCNTGWYGSRCDKFNCSVSNCDSCVANQPSVCATCKTGWYLTAGSCLKCSDNCQTANNCDKITGTCTGGCTSGWYGDKCIESCTTNCLQGLCDINGICSNGCNGKRYGQKCDSSCSNCMTSCNRDTGACDTGGCLSGYHGTHCSQSCNINCLNNMCNQGDGKCTSGCKTGFFGEFCQSPCSSSCVSNSCNATNGACDGDCATGKYGQYCEYSCSTQCSQLTCEKIGGACTSSCVTGYHGSQCNMPCSSTCLNNECQKTDGSCTSGCFDGRYGSICDLYCSINCNGTKCDRDSGSCSGGCKVGYYGDTCQTMCPQCDSSGCQRVTGTCIGNTVVREDGGIDMAIIIGAVIAGAVVLLIIIIVVGCHCLRKKARQMNESTDILTPQSSGSIEGIDNMHYRNFDEIQKDDWVMRNHALVEVKQNGILRTREQAEAPLAVYEIHHQIIESSDSESSLADGPAPPSVRFCNFDGKNGIQVEMLPQYVDYMMKKKKGFEDEFNDLKEGLLYPHEEAIKPGNKSKNRYKNIYAYDHSRVVLKVDPVEQESTSPLVHISDYINASFIDGYNNEKAYIACQGPTDESVDDFWRMVWQYRIQTVVMLTNLVELGKVKCKKYWPDENRTEKYGNLYVKFDYQETFADFTLTNLVVTQEKSEEEAGTDKGEDEFRLQVKHLQFTSWPDRGVPRYVTPLVEFYCKVKSLGNDGPLLVHCSAGVGRSGTFIGLDYLMDQADNLEFINVFKCVEMMRAARPNMVQTPDQYCYLHQALAEALQTSESPVDEDEFENYCNQMIFRDPQSGLSKLYSEYDAVKSSKIENHYEAATSEENKHRNRSSSILACDDCRVFLWSKIKGCTDYINAIYLPSYRNKYCFIATEMPQCATIIDFCRMIFQEEVRTVVMLDNETAGINPTEHYWPNPGQTMECGPFSIQITEEQHNEDFTVRNLNFKFCVDDQKGTYKVNQFHYKCWSEGKVTPKSVESFVSFVKAVTEWQSDSVKHPIITHCMDGATKVGLFCMVRACLDRLQSDGDVSPVHTLHHFHARRSQLLPNFEQYKFCHDCILQEIRSS